MQYLGLPYTLLGVDVIRDAEVVKLDATAAELLELLRAEDGADILVTAIGGQGHIIGRGNQQLSPEVLRSAGLENLRVLAGKGKIASLQGRPLLVDSNDPELDRELSGYRLVHTGYQDQVLYPVSAGL